MTAKTKTDRGSSLLSVFSRNYDILLELHPGNEYSLSKLSERTGKNIGSISRAVGDLQEHKLINVREEREGRGKPHKYVKLSQFSRQLLDYVKEYLEKKLIDRPSLDPRVINEYLDIIKNDDLNTRKFASDQIELMSRNNKISKEMRLFAYIKENIFNPEINDVKYNLITTLLNIAKYSGEETLDYISSLYKEDLLKLIFESENRTDEYERIALTSIQILLEILSPEEGYETLSKAYIKSIKEKSPNRDRYQNLLLSKYSEKKVDIQLMLINMYRTSDETLRAIIETQINNLA